MGISEEQHDGESGGGLGFFYFLLPSHQLLFKKITRLNFLLIPLHIFRNEKNLIEFVTLNVTLKDRRV